MYIFSIFRLYILCGYIIPRLSAFCRYLNVFIDKLWIVVGNRFARMMSRSGNLVVFVLGIVIFILLCVFMRNDL